MAAVKTEKNTQPTDTTPGCVDEIDIEQFINADSFSAASPMSPDSASFKTSTSATPISNPLQYPTQQPEQTFAGPSHQYDQYRQQASLPVGAIANTFALNESVPYSFGQDNYDLIASNSYLGSNIADDYLDLDIGTTAEQLDLDMDFNMDSSAFGSSGAGVSSSQPRFQSSSTQHVRAWPGMHQQAAMQAKAQAEAEAQRQSQAKKQSQTQKEFQTQAREGSAGRAEAEDPHVEESISRLLHRMRHSSVSSTNADDSATLSNGGTGTHGSRPKKDEEEMDEDERLLASEEGKKLSSKERRQLRNKVSARAFRSRRKEYIGQLEGELAAKAAEADRLRIRNEQLSAENSRLTDLTRMLLSSPHFSTFLDELSANRGTLPSFGQVTAQQQPQQTQQTQPQQQQLPSQPPKDANPISHQTNLHIGLATIPESSYESNNGWAQNAAFDQRVFALTDIPDEPVIDSKALSGKSVIEPLSSFGTKDDAPEMQIVAESKVYQSPSTQMPTVPEYPVDEEVEFNESDSAFALFSDEARPSMAHNVPSITSSAMLEDVIGEKTPGHFTIAVRTIQGSMDQESGRAVMCKLERMRAHMDSLGERIDKLCGEL